MRANPPMIRFLASIGWHLTSGGDLIYDREELEERKRLRSAALDNITNKASPDTGTKEGKRWTDS